MVGIHTEAAQHCSKQLQLFRIFLAEAVFFNGSYIKIYKYYYRGTTASIFDELFVSFGMCIYTRMYGEFFWNFFDLIIV